jgi:hypothetical protein
MIKRFQAFCPACSTITNFYVTLDENGCLIGNQEPNPPLVIEELKPFCACGKAAVFAGHVAADPAVMYQPIFDRHQLLGDLPVYRIPEQNHEAFVSRMDKMNRRAKRLRMDPLVIKMVGEEFVTRRRRFNAFKVVEYTVRFVLVTVTGTLPRVNGWAMAATLQHSEGGNILRTVPGFETMLPLKYRTADTCCDHCHTSRKRTDTYVLQHENGSWRQVGRSCLADFIRTTNPSGLAEYAEMLADLDHEISGLEDEGEGEGFGGSGCFAHFPTLALLTQVACCVRLDGWCSRTEAKANYWDNKVATVDQALDFFDEKRVAKMSRNTIEKYTPAEEDMQRAVEAIAWAQNLPSDVSNDYLWNIRVVSNREHLSHRESGLAGSIISAYNRHLEKELANKYERENALNEHFGEIGKRTVYTLTVTGLREIDGHYGKTTIVKFRDVEGRIAVWFASGNPSFDAEIGGTYTVKATPKKHDVYKDWCQTVLSRIVLHVEKPKASRKRGKAVLETEDLIVEAA